MKNIVDETTPFPIEFSLKNTCGCSILKSEKESVIVYCHLHDAATDLYIAAKGAIPWLDGKLGLATNLKRAVSKAEHQYD